MQNKRIIRHPFSSIKTAIAFTAIVFILLGIATSIKVFQTIQKSIFDGQHQFVLLIISANNKATIAAIDPKNNTFSAVYISNPKKEDIQKNMALGIDGSLHTSSSISNKKDIEQVLFSSIFSSLGNKTQLTWYDLLRLYGTSRVIGNQNVQESSLTLPANSDVIKNIDGQFVDSALQQENITIQIINASDITGLGQQLETLLTNSGFSVIDVRTNQTSINSSVINYDNYDYATMPYTVSKLGRILGFSLHGTNKQMIANVQIIIGKDNADNSKLFIF
ncbi:MAG TPA: LytR C-terminal domain-containing protein [Patescibacteria group bacterium]|nr:LytR C-terminal domain-containing protein [Patescibacteria group bacterium]